MALRNELMKHFYEQKILSKVFVALKGDKKFPVKIRSSKSESCIYNESNSFNFLDRILCPNCKNRIIFESELLPFCTIDCKINYKIFGKHKSCFKKIEHGIKIR
mgnify:FL=1|tara:strand:- start:115 stop:426 length:312 start_codon:yes stop_codon:yes gene_type:complete